MCGSNFYVSDVTNRNLDLISVFLPDSTTNMVGLVTAEPIQNSDFRLGIYLKHLQLLSFPVSEGFISPKEIIKIQLYNVQSNTQAVHSLKSARDVALPVNQSEL